MYLFVIHFKNVPIEYVQRLIEYCCDIKVYER